MPGTAHMLDDQGSENMDRDKIASGEEVDDACVCSSIECFETLNQKENFLHTPFL